MRLRPLLVSATLCAACTDGKRDVDVVLAEPAPTQPAEPTVPAPYTTRMPAVRVHTSATVMDVGTGPQLCLMNPEESLPPQCGGPPILGWDWAAVAGKSQAGPITWGKYHVVGDFDGVSFKLAEPPGPALPRPRRQPLETPCSAPAGGWARPDPRRTEFEDRTALFDRAVTLPGFAGGWYHDPPPPKGEDVDPAKVVVNVAFVGDAQRHEATLREVWGGALCMISRDRTPDDLEPVRRAADELLSSLGRSSSSSGIDTRAMAVKIELDYADAALRATLDERFGVGVVALESWLRPYPEPAGTPTPSRRAEPGEPARVCKDRQRIDGTCRCEAIDCDGVCCVGSTCEHQTDGRAPPTRCVGPRL